ncbi:MAG: hypothetical protein FWF84_02935, partial [Kiritimatiellaeota bacterium]|nr:hypothetical protein [Kiritimatiellota bacterium]
LSEGATAWKVFYSDIPSSSVEFWQLKNGKCQAIVPLSVMEDSPTGFFRARAVGTQTHTD